MVSRPGKVDPVMGKLKGFSSLFADGFLMFVLGAIFGKIMAVSGAVANVAWAVVVRIGIGGQPIAS